MTRRIVIAGTASSTGKSSLTLGLMGAFRRRGCTVQGFKCGPDYIDSAYHTAVTGRVSRNLDSWMLEASVLQEIYAHGSRGADLSIIEGAMGMYDGRSAADNTGSTAEVSQLLEAPVLLVLNAASMGRSAAAVVKGFQALEGGSRIVAAVANRVGSDSHYRLVKEAIQLECGLPVIGCMKREKDIEIPERHLGLVPSVERGELQPLFDRLADIAESHIDLDALWSLARAEPLPPVAGTALFQTGPGGGSEETEGSHVRIAVARDQAFHFYYPENLELLEQAGAKLVFFSPLAGEELPPGVAGLYIGGGFPEEYAPALEACRQTRASVHAAVEAGMPTIAECGGFMYLCRHLQRLDGALYEMAGIIPGRAVMQETRVALGYREVRGLRGNWLLGEDGLARGHEYHYSAFVPDADAALPFAYESKGRLRTANEGFLYKNAVAGYTHIHFASNPSMAGRFVAACRQWLAATQ